MVNILTTLLLTFSFDLNMEAARVSMLNADYDQTLKILNKIDVKKVNRINYFCYKMISNFSLNYKDKALEDLKQIEDSFDKLPRRYEMLVAMMKYDLQAWKAGDLSDIVRDMNIVKNRLDLAKAGSQTQVVQKTIISKLDKLIKSEEDKQKGDGNSAQKDGSSPDSGNQPVPGQERSSDPAKESIIMGGAGKGVVDDKKLRQFAANWGTLPPLKRQEVVNEITRDLPAKYKPMIEDYFKSLNKSIK